MNKNFIASHYKEYLKKKFPRSGAASSYNKSIEIVDECCSEWIEDKGYKSIFEVDDLDLIEKIYSIVKENEDNLNNNIKSIFDNIEARSYPEHGHCSASVKCFKDFVTAYLILFDSVAQQIGIDNSSTNKKKNLQQIFYGAPGTGKSHTIDGMTNEKNSIRTTFHPDSDYASFVGAYKPMMDKVPVPEFNDKDKNPINEEKKIVYKYEPQVFLKAYVEAWKRYLNRKEGEDDSYYLVIEEINRGNCAQIFGDIFQLLDRDDNNGFSSYAISSDSAIAKYLDEDAACENSKFSELDFSDVTKNCDGVTKIIATAEELKSGKKLVLPPNLYIWATMNTSDQSLFPIDSAFKRRWEWKYVPIKYSNTDWRIELGDKMYSWVVFQEKINDKIKDATDGSEDKQMGDFFVKAKNNVIDEDLLLNKIVFYLWNDVCKEGEGDIFKLKNGDKTEDISFSQFFKEDSILKLQQWMDYLEVDLYSDPNNNVSVQNQENIESANDEIN